jgi:hypothetical protein
MTERLKRGQGYLFKLNLIDNIVNTANKLFRRTV